jgi:hypothetical protein
MVDSGDHDPLQYLLFNQKIIGCFFPLMSNNYN